MISRINGKVVEIVAKNGTWYAYVGGEAILVREEFPELERELSIIKLTVEGKVDDTKKDGLH